MRARIVILLLIAVAACNPKEPDPPPCPPDGGIGGTGIACDGTDLGPAGLQ